MMNEEPTSLEYERVNTTELYPQKALITDDNRLHVPFPCLPGECVEYLGRTVDGVVALSNFRLLVKFKDSFVNIPIGLIELIESRDIFYLNIYCKDATVVRCAFSTNDTCMQWFQRLLNAAAPKKKLEETFAFRFYAWCKDGGWGSTEIPNINEFCQPADGWVGYNFSHEVDRMQFKLGAAWRITYINQDFKMCVSYPSEHIVPANINDEELQAASDFRALSRFPSIVWRDQRNGAVLLRSSQPQVGWLGWRNSKDENLLTAVSEACARDPGTDNAIGHSENTKNVTSCSEGMQGAGATVKVIKRMLIVDARSYGAAFANRAKGGGCECSEYYLTCDVQFMNLANIHSIRKSFQALRTLCAAGPDQANWLSSLETTKWLHNISAVLKASMVVVGAIDKEARPVLVHCSDGWDRTSQIVSLTEIILDPYYRTMKGFQVLVEREWLQFGHKFADRCGHSVTCEDTNERCPVFLQWLDCVHQLLQQFPCSFEFNQAFLVKLIQHTYSCLFGTFLCNTVAERTVYHVHESTCSVWTFLQSGNSKFFNYLYSPDTSNQVLQPSYNIRNMALWSAVYLQNNLYRRTNADDPLSTSFIDESHSSEQLTKPDANSVAPQKTRSCDDILAALEHSAKMNRRLSDPNIPLEVLGQMTGNLGNKPADLVALENEICVSDETENCETEKNEELNGECDDVDFKNDSPTKLSNGNNNWLDLDLKCYDSISLNSGDINVNGHCGDDDDDSDISVLETETQIHRSYDAQSCNNAHKYSNGPTSRIDCDDSSRNEFYDDSYSLEITNHEDCIYRNDGIKSTATYNHDAYQLNDVDVLRTVLDNKFRINSSSHSHNNCMTVIPDNNVDGDVYSVNNVPRIGNGFLHHESVESHAAVINECEKSHHSTSTLTGDLSSSISTSTTDISDSRIHKIEANNCSKRNATTNGDCQRLVENAAECVKLRLNCDTAYSCKPWSNASNSSDSSTPPHSSSQGSTCPNTPAVDSATKMTEPNWTAPRHGLARHLDCDGLMTYTDPGQTRVQQIESEYRQKIASLERRVQLLRQALLDHQHCNCHMAVDVAPEQVYSMENVDCHSGNGSDLSWEQLDERDSEVVKWVPDHVVTHCAGCEAEFWLVKRKHHCRRCGKIFCSDCSSLFIPVPQQHLMEPARD